MTRRTKRRSPPANVPAERDAFVGRSELLARLRAEFERGGRVVTLTGTAGIGKSRLAGHFAHAALAADAACALDGAFWCDLSEARSLAGVCGALARAIEPRVTVAAGRGDDGALDACGAALAELGSALVVLDDCDLALASVRAAVERWTAAAPRVSLLATSRERLAAQGERVLELAPLSLPAGAHDIARSEAVQLLVARWRSGAAHVDHDRDDDVDADDALERLAARRDADAIARIACALDGIPLALELAAERLAVLGAEALSARLADRFAVLGQRASARRRPRGRETLRDAIQFSWNMLDATERAALAQCAVFRGGFRIEAAEAIVELPARPPLLEVLESLRRKSLLVLHEPRGDDALPRYAMFASIREFAAQMLAADGGGDGRARDAAALRHARYYAALGEHLGDGAYGREGRLRVAQLRAELDNLLAAVDRMRARAAGDRDIATVLLRLLVALDVVVRTHGAVREYLGELDTALALGRAAGCDASLLARAIAVRCAVGRRRAGREQALAEIAEALALVRSAGDRVTEGRIVRTQGTLLFDLGRLEEARRAFEQALAIQRAEGDRDREAVTLRSLGALLLGMGEPAAAIATFERALEVLRTVGGSWYEAHVLGDLGTACADERRFAEAREHYERALAISQQAADRSHEGYCAVALGCVLHEEGRLDAAVAQYERARGVLRRAGERRLEALTTGYLGVALHELARPTDARASLGAAVATLSEVGDRRLEALFRAHLAALDVTQHRLESAERGIAAALAVLEPGDVLRDAGRVLEAYVLAARAGASSGDAAARGRDQAWAALAQIAAPAPAPRAPATRSQEVRMALRIAQRYLCVGAPVEVATAVRLALAGAPAGPGAGELVVGANGERLWLPDGRAVDVSAHRVAARLLHALAEQRVRAPGRAVPVPSLIAAGWPAERILPRAARNRLHVELNYLRRVGLREVLRAQTGGYLLDPAVPVRLVAD